MMKFLVKYGIHTKGISVEETELTKVKDIIKESFNIEDRGSRDPVSLT
jgi:hypothetical protein